MFPTLEDGVVGMRDEVLEMGLLIRRRRNLVLPTVTCDKSHTMCDSQCPDIKDVINSKVRALWADLEVHSHTR